MIIAVVVVVDWIESVDSVESIQADGLRERTGVSQVALAEDLPSAHLEETAQP